MKFSGQNDYARVRIFDTGHRVQLNRKRTRAGGGIRGKVHGFSSASRRRLLDWLLTMEVPDRRPACVTFTLKDHCTPEQWRIFMARWRRRINHHGIAGVWRVELQRRGTPHLHCLLWLDPNFVMDNLADWWCETVEGDHEVYQYGVLARWYDGASAWMLYCGGHVVKDNQSGWIGRHWGIWGKRFFVERHSEIFEMTYNEYVEFRRRANVLSNKRGSGNVGYQGHRRVGQCCGLNGVKLVRHAKQKGRSDADRAEDQR